MKIIEILIVVSMIVFSLFVMLYHPYRPLSLVIGMREYDFEHSTSDLRSVGITADRPIRDFFMNATNFTVTFDPSSSKDNAYFSKIGFNMVSKLRYFFVDMGSQKNFVAKFYNDLNDSDRNVIIMRGPHSGAIKNGVTLRGNTMIIEGLTYDELSKSAERAVLEVFGLNVSSMKNSDMPVVIHSLPAPAH